MNTSAIWRALGTCHSELSNGDLLSDEMNVELNVLCTPVMNGIPRHIHRGDIVAECHRCCWYFAEELAEEVAKPGTLRDGIGDGAVLGLRARSRDCGLPF